MVPATEAARLVGEVRRLKAESRAHKSEEKRQRERSKRKAQEADELLERCRALGIRVEEHELDAPVPPMGRIAEPGETRRIAADVTAELHRRF